LCQIANVWDVHQTLAFDNENKIYNAISKLSRYFND
jgi:hypothetical protein